MDEMQAAAVAAAVAEEAEVADAASQPAHQYRSGPIANPS